MVQYFRELTDDDIMALRERVRALEHEQQACSQTCTGLEIERDALRALLAQASVALANVSGALCDAGSVVPDEAHYGDAVRAIVAERDALRDERDEQAARPGCSPQGDRLTPEERGWIEAATGLKDRITAASHMMHAAYIAQLLRIIDRLAPRPGGSEG